eukprot:m.126179 g.126179  ORF g.126179 m.126179 type:complete len:354 (+) comp17357_c0_seq1:244-1305(+)
MGSSWNQMVVFFTTCVCLQMVEYSTSLSLNRALAEDVTGEWTRARQLALQPEELRCIDYLFQWAPSSDLRSPNITAEFLLETVQLALFARNATVWGRSVPEPVFLNDVLPYAVLSEPRGVPDWSWRSKFMSAFLPQVQSMPNASMAAEAGINTICWKLTSPAIVFKGAPNCEINSYAPATTIQQKYSSCTGLAVYVALALRSIGIPARVAGVPHWNKCNAPPGEERSCTACPHGDTCTPGDKSSDDACGNHDWAEAFIDGAWHFIDPEGSKTLDDGWFVDNTKLQTAHTSTYLNHSILASSWAPSAWLLANEPEYYRDSSAVDFFPMVWAWSDHSVQGFDVTQRYTKGFSGNH